ncbi:MAG: hypothetical protein FWD72_06550, partial [Eggerthellaceae bacterium]|nr:hypothetical protein [Eggerthellaceae bacterium]
NTSPMEGFFPMSCAASWEKSDRLFIMGHLAFQNALGIARGAKAALLNLGCSSRQSGPSWKALLM